MQKQVIFDHRISSKIEKRLPSSHRNKIGGEIGVDEDNEDTEIDLIIQRVFFVILVETGGGEASARIIQDRNFNKTLDTRLRGYDTPWVTIVVHQYRELFWQVSLYY